MAGGCRSMPSAAIKSTDSPKWRPVLAGGDQGARSKVHGNDRHVHQLVTDDCEARPEHQPTPYPRSL